MKLCGKVRLGALACVLTLAHCGSFVFLNNTSCLDGTPAGYYYREGVSVNRSHWVLLLGGGNTCHSDKECNNLKGGKGSSSSWSTTDDPTTTAFTMGVLSTQVGINPDFSHGIMFSSQSAPATCTLARGHKPLCTSTGTTI